MNEEQVADTLEDGSTSEVSDADLAIRVQGGDREAFELLARRYMRSVYAVASSILTRREDVDDSVQETFLRVLKKIHSYKPRKPFAPWLYQVARNIARNRWKYVKSRQHEDISNIDERTGGNRNDDPGQHAERSELRNRVAAAIEGLPERQRAAFRLHDIEGFRASEIADMLGVSDGTVRANVHHARRALRQRLEPYHLDREA